VLENELLRWIFELKRVEVALYRKEKITQRGAS
jgi:hypothetical protein